MRRTFALGALTLSLCGASMIPSIASAAPPPGPKNADAFDDGGFVYLQPGFAAIALPGLRATTASAHLDPSFQWGLGGGYMFRRKAFMATVGGRFEHMLYNLDREWTRGSQEAFGSGFRILGDVRLGGGIDWIYGYGYIDPGLIVSVLSAEGFDDNDCARLDDTVGPDVDRDDIDLDGDNCAYDEVDPGFNMGLGAGLMVKIWRGLFIGGEFGVDIAVLDDDRDPWQNMYTFDASASVGWAF